MSRCIVKSESCSFDRTCWTAWANHSLLLRKPDPDPVLGSVAVGKNKGPGSDAADSTTEGKKGRER